MDKSDIDPKILDQIKKLEEKYEVMGQDLSSYLDGLLYSDYLTYWDYIHLDTLLSLQNPKTRFKDEMIFIIYHQITELYFKLVLWELEQTANTEELSEDEFIMRLDRIINYFENLIRSFDIMVDGMEKDQFLKFRMSLLPASGFQSVQYRLIEIYSTKMINLVPDDEREGLKENDIKAIYDKLYWKKGSSELATGKKTLTLRQFEEKYYRTFIEKGEEMIEKNLYKVYYEYFSESERRDEIIERLKNYDVLVNITWSLAHYKSAVRYLHKDPDDIAATGGTNWQKYLPPRFQKIYFFPDLLTKQEKLDWGKSWVRKEVFHSK